MRRLFLLLSGMLLISTTTYAQIKKEFSASGLKKLHLIVDDAKVLITTGSSSQIVLTSNDVPPIPERAKGLKPLYNNATDNTGAGMQMTREGEVMVFKKARSYDATYEIQVPANLHIQIDETNWTGGDFKITGVRGEVEINAKSGAIFLDQVSGPITASSTSGNIEVVFNNMNADKPSFISNISGVIDITLNKGKADLNISNISGEIYSSYDLSKTKGELKSYGRNKVKASLNGGGAEIKLKNISGDIYIRE